MHHHGAACRIHPYEPAVLDSIVLANVLHILKPEHEYGVYSWFVRMTYHSYETWSFSVHESHGSNVKQYVDCKLHFRLWSQEDRSNRRIKRKKNKKMWKISNLTFRKRCSVNSLPSKSIWRSNINTGSQDKTKHQS